MKFKIETNKSKEEVLKIITENTYITKSVFDRITGGKYFRGTVAETFKIQRCINYKNSFLPVIIGKITPAAGGCAISIKMRLNNFVKGFMTFWFAVVGLFCLITPSSEFNFPLSFIPYIMLLFGILLVTNPFIIEAKIAKTKLEELLN